MKWPKPRIIIHPGLPKCATSAIQQAFVLENHALPRALKVSFLSAGFKRNQGHPDVIRIMDDPEGFLNDLEQAVFLRQRYFLSSEALLSIDLSPFCQRFNVERWAVTTRLPIAQAISNYRYSGWISGGFEDWAGRPENDFNTIATRQITKIAKLKDLPGDLVIVPLEAAAYGKAVPLFCERVFDVAPELVDTLRVDTGQQVNRSISFALADTLGRKLKARDIGPVDATLRRALVRAAKDFVLAQSLVGLAPESLRDTVQPFVEAAGDHYASLLELSDKPARTRNVLNVSIGNLAKFAEMPSATADQQAELDAQADRILDSCLAGRPA